MPEHLLTGKRKNGAKINSAVVIPALNPVPRLVDLVKELLARGIPQVIVVNDGSDSAYNAIFQAAAKFERCTVLTHKTNRGKGRALKTAFTYFNERFSYLDGVVTADADGQHAAEDICAIAERLSLHEGCLVLGVRNFRENDVPRRSYLGNVITSRIFWMFYGQYLQDTQTGLRGIPARELRWMAEMRGERYDYEINMLIKARFRQLDLLLVPIQTLYFDNNSGSHYKTVKDSARVFWCLISGLRQYVETTVISGIIDVLGFFVLYTFAFSDLIVSERIFASTVIARVVSSAGNYALNRRIIFSDSGRVVRSAFRYYILWFGLMLSSYALVLEISRILRVNVVLIKISGDFFLGLLSYQIQLRWVFKHREHVDSSFPPGVKSRYRLNGFIYWVSRFIVRCFTRRYQVRYADELAQPVVYVVHHQNLRGPVMSLAWFDRPLFPWIFHVFCEQSACFRQYYGYTFTKRFGLPKPLAALIAWPLSFFIARLMLGSQGIPVYRDSKAIIRTFWQSLNVLKEGKSLLICPDIDYTDTGESMGEMHLGFLNLDKFYYEQTGNHLAFVPLYVSKRTAFIYAGKAVGFDTADNFKQERAKVYERLKKEFQVLEALD